MDAKDYMPEWLDKKYGGSKDLGDWTPEDVVQFAEAYNKKKIEESSGYVCRIDGVKKFVIANNIADAIDKIEKAGDDESFYIMETHNSMEIII